jgi:hypothetical protein
VPLVNPRGNRLFIDAGDDDEWAITKKKI